MTEKRIRTYEARLLCAISEEWADLSGRMMFHKEFFRIGHETDLFGGGRFSYVAFEISLEIDEKDELNNEILFQKAVDFMESKGILIEIRLTSADFVFVALPAEIMSDVEESPPHYPEFMFSFED